MTAEPGLTVTSLNGVRVAVYAISSCTIHGSVPHRVGEHGSLTCEACRVREDEYQARIARAREAS